MNHHHRRHFLAVLAGAALAAPLAAWSQSKPLILRRDGSRDMFSRHG